MLRRIRIFFQIYRNFGLAHALNFSYKWLFKVSTQGNLNDFVTLEVFDIKNSQDKPLLSKEIYSDKSPLVWFVPAWSNVWGGGHFTLFRFAHMMSTHRQNIIYVYDNEGRYSVTHFKDSLRVPFPDNNLKVLTDPTDIPLDAITLATTWQSVYSVLNLKPDAFFKFYFMQDYENLFYAHGTQSMQALESYKQGFIPIAGSPWLLNKYIENSGDGGVGMNYMFTVDHEIFYSTPKEQADIKRVFFYGRPSTERRCFELGIAALKLIKEKYPNIEIVMAGLDGIGNVGFEATDVGSVPLPKLGELYRSCDIGIALSGTNLSYLPVELMACGIPVISNNGPHVEWFCESEVNSLVVPPFPSQILTAVERLLADKDLYFELRKNGLRKTAESNWLLEAEKIHEFILSTQNSHFS